MKLLDRVRDRLVALEPQDRLLARGLLAMAAYLVIAHCTFGDRIEQAVIVVLTVGACALGARSRRFACGLLPFALLGMVYDCMRLFRPLLPIRVAEMYTAEKALFGLGTGAARITLNELFARHHWVLTDLACGVAYMIYLYVAVGLALALAIAGRRHERLLGRYGWTFFFVNMAGFATYYLFPAAPPWYVAAHGLGPALIGAPPSPAALARFDALVGFPYFAGFYRRSADVFGSLPSLHCAYPMVVFLYARELGRRWLSVPLLGFYVLVVFSAVYLQHHYLLDALAGTAYAIVGYLLERRLDRGALSSGTAEVG